MVGQNSFCQSNINTFFVTCVVSNIDTRITTYNKVEWKLKEKILIVKSKYTEFGVNK